MSLDFIALASQVWSFLEVALYYSMWFLVWVFAAAVFLGNTVAFTLGRIYVSKSISNPWRSTLFIYLSGLILVNWFLFNWAFIQAFIMIWISIFYNILARIYCFIFRMDYKLLDGDLQSLVNGLLGFDQAGNAFIYGNHDEVTSGWLGKLKLGLLDREAYWNESLFMWLLNILDPTSKYHFIAAVERDERSPNEKA